MRRQYSPGWKHGDRVFRKQLIQLSMLILFGAPASAHEGRPLYVEVSETAPKSYYLQWKIASSVALSNTPTVHLPDGCEKQTQPAEFNHPDGLVRRVRYHCGTGIAGHSIAIVYPDSRPSISTLIRYTTISGERHIGVLSPQETNWIVPQAETATAVARQYMLLGFKHIWAGVDHLLFLLCLLWIAGTRRRILVAITGFTLAHSATLILSALQFVRVPIPPIEAAIALSIVVLATEILRDGHETLTRRYPIAVSSSFGLLHGFGFASALRETGLPQVERATGLLFFNVGVEIGQLLFSAGVIGLMRLATRACAVDVDLHQASTLRKLLAYAIGSLGVCWLIQRVAAF